MSEQIVVKTITIASHRIEISFDFTEGLSPYFDSGQRTFWQEYTEDMSGVPSSTTIYL